MTEAEVALPAQEASLPAETGQAEQGVAACPSWAFPYAYCECDWTGWFCKGHEGCARRSDGVKVAGYSFSCNGCQDLGISVSCR